MMVLHTQKNRKDLRKKRKKERKEGKVKERKEGKEKEAHRGERNWTNGFVQRRSFHRSSRILMENEGLMTGNEGKS